MDQEEAVPAHPFTSVPIEIVVSVGKSKPTIQELLSFEKDSVIKIDRKIDDPVEIYAGSKLIALGNLEETSEEGKSSLCVRLTQIMNITSDLV